MSPPRLLVGGYVRERKSPEDAAPQDAYCTWLMSRFKGVKLKLEEDLSGQFIEDCDLMPFGQAERVAKSRRTAPICPSLRECRAANWYCLRNRNPNGEMAPGDRALAPLPPNAPER